MFTSKPSQKSFLESFTIYLQEDQYIIMQHDFYQRPDKFQVINGDKRNSSSSELTYENKHGDWYLAPERNNSNHLFSYIGTI